MVVLMFKNLDIPEGFTHKASDWQISADKYFRKDYIVAQSLNDTKHLTSILFDVDLDPDKVYYARARVIMDYGPSDWSDIDIIRTEDLDKIGLDTDIPTVVGKPEVSVNFPLDQVPPTMFKIITSPISLNSNAKHMSTDYYITDLLGNIMFMSFDNTSDLTSKLMSEVMLPEDNFYLIKVSHKASSGDISPLGQKLIYVPGNNVIELLSNSVVDNATKSGMNIKLKTVKNVNKIYVKMYMVGADDPVEVFNTVEDKFVFDIPAQVFKNPNSTYLLSLQYEYVNGKETPVKYFRLLAS